MVYAEQFADPDTSIAQAPDELLRRARMILATELGKDPLLRHAARDLFKREATISVLPTDRGISRIDEHHEYYVSSIFSDTLCNDLVNIHRISNIFMRKRSQICWSLLSSLIY
jgi:transcription elongation factor SPT6